jgi:hypothetical protein
MRTSLLGVALLVAVQMFGCTDSVEDNCKTMCDWSDDCGDGAPENCTKNCIESMKDADDACRDALDDFADCVEIHECEDGECGGEAAGVLADCAEFF